MKKIVKVVGGKTLGVTFSTEDRRAHGIDEGDIVDLSNMIIEKQNEIDENISNIMAKQKQPKVINKIRGMME